MKTRILICGLILSFFIQHSFGSEVDTIVFENVNVIPMDKKIILENHRVVVANGKIVSVEPGEISSQYRATKTIDGTGKFLIPGLSEMHYHWRNERGGIERDFKMLIANGVTTVRNMAEYDWQDQIAEREKANSGTILAPNYYTTGPYLKAFDIPTEEDAVRVVKEHKGKGYDYLKIADDLPKNIYLKVLNEASKNGIDVIGHGQHQLPLEFSLRMKSIEHTEEFVYLFGDEHLEDPGFLKSAVEQIKISGVTVVPTLVVFDMILKYLDDKEFSKLKNQSDGKYLLANDHEYWLSENNPYRKDLKERIINGEQALPLLTKYYKWMLKFTRTLSDNGIPLMTGSDTFGFVVMGFSLHKEFEFLHEAGLTPFEILKASTVTPARFLNKIAVEGTVSEGKNANMVLLTKNPLEDIRNTNTIEGVMLKGQWLDREKLDSLLTEVEESK
ncbi:MAG TPA: amidohydrolase family protein [Draconibacterium sp.]|nr:amidohydrolase family protein [Draconibacterium sp.]